jgi:hypothetical protein
MMIWSNYFSWPTDDAYKIESIKVPVFVASDAKY